LYLEIDSIDGDETGERSGKVLRPQNRFGGQRATS
jgi:hypothetical protein